MDLVFFDKNGAKYVKNHILLPHRNPFLKVIKNPDLSLVKDEPPIFWELRNNTIVEMSRPNKVKKLKFINKEHQPSPMTILYPWWMKLPYLLLLVALIYWRSRG